MTQRGFVLVATLWTLVVVFLLVASIDDAVEAELDRAIQMRDGIRNRLDLVATEAVVRYLLASGRRTTGGFVVRPENVQDIINVEGAIDPRAIGGEMVADGRPYRGFGNVVFALQDERGLIGINSAVELPMQTFLRSAGGKGGSVRRLLDVLADYRDMDNFPRLAGAERGAYAAKGLAAPRNDFLRSANEISRLIVWRDLNVDPGWFSESRMPAINFNTMPAVLLPYFFGAASDTVRAERSRRPFFRPSRIKEWLIGADRWPDEYFFYTPGDRLRVLFGAGGQCLLIALELTPLDVRSPTRERYRYEFSCDVISRFPSPHSTLTTRIFWRLGALADDPART